jgi:class I fructose-bisphosphate aldolase
MGRRARSHPIPGASVQDALRLGCCAVGFTIYPGSAHQLEMYGQLRAYAEEEKRNGLAVVIWSYPRGSGLSKDDESAIDVVVTPPSSGHTSSR